MIDARTSDGADEPGRPGGEWTFLTNHAHVLICLAKDPTARQRDIARDVGITERAAQKIITELEAEGYVERIKVGRRNRYELHTEIPLRHPLEWHRDVGALLELITGRRSG
jgi:predicted transcriptional regulator